MLSTCGKSTTNKKFRYGLKLMFGGRGYALTTLGLLNGHYYLMIVDSFSKWPEMHKCKLPTPTNTIKVLNELFSRFGVPKTLVSDNGTQFTGRKFKNFCTSFSIDYITSTVYHPRSNGQVERFVDTFKRALRNNQGMDTDERSIQKFFIVYRMNPPFEHRFRPFTSQSGVRKKIR